MCPFEKGARYERDDNPCCPFHEAADLRDIPNQCDVAAQHVYELRQISDPSVPQKGAASCLARALIPSRSGGLLDDLPCGPEAEKPELLAIPPHASAAMEHRSGAFQLNRQSDKHHQRES